jgi:hypothetical protein
MASRAKIYQRSAIRGTLWVQLAAKLVRLLAECCLLIAAAAPTARSQTLIAEDSIIGADGALTSGTIRVWPSAAFDTSGGIRVETVQSVVRVVNGAFSVALWPNPAGVWYNARWQLDGARPRLELWDVPPCATALTPSQVLASVSLNNGIVTVGWASGQNPCPGAAQSWAAVTSMIWSQITASIWSGITP